MSRNYEFIYVHLMKRKMEFTSGIEKESSFLIIPNKFVHDHELSPEEINIFTTPDPEYVKTFRRPKRSLLKFLRKRNSEKIINIKLRFLFIR